ncbi:bifunctional biotin--[acetyl-CoA-carboxylase] ligase/biotin operon repressor BirA [Shewanella maritima]|uniref:bifunctional biotin--[acetyl-CoA-carboxylase] ligase/biotin operon repressor BirA n=1 Tax=Shewanella maritima TaxID=2520507 RepID=UPI003735637E
MTNEHWARKRQILAQLSHDKFVSGEAIAQQLQLSRMAVNQHIDAMGEYGIDIFSVKGKGYQLAAPISLIEESLLLKAIDKRCFYFNEIDSTNEFMLNHASELSAGDICISEYQSKGRGRRGRTWQSPYGHHLYASMFWRTHLQPQALMGLSLVVGCSLVSALQGLKVEGLGLKWPNDVYLDGRKLAGILIELGQPSDSQTQIVVGFGINMNMPLEQGNLIDQPWSDLSGRSGIDKTDLMANIHQQLQDDFATFEAKGLTPFIERWNNADLFIGKPVTLSMAPNEVSGICQGIDEQGGIVISTEAGNKAYIGGEISLRSTT